MPGSVVRDKPSISESQAQPNSANQHRQASRSGKPVWEGARPPLRGAPAILVSNCGSFVLRVKALKDRALSDRATAGHAFVRLRKVFFMDSRLLIFASISAIFASARLLISALFAV